MSAAVIRKYRGSDDVRFSGIKYANHCLWQLLCQPQIDDKLINLRVILSAVLISIKLYYYYDKCCIQYQNDIYCLIII